MANHATDDSSNYGYCNDKPRNPYEAAGDSSSEWSGNNSRGRYAETAESLGTAIGSAVDSVRRIPEMAQEGAEELRKKFEVIRGRAMENAKARTSHLVHQAQQTAGSAKDLTEQLAQESPLQFIAGAAIAGAFVGLVLGLWRNHD